ncbi:MAG: formate dehydrogenase, partial [Alphaproteobacteria bacterium]
MNASNHRLDLAPPVSDEVRRTTCYMCACRCGINVHLREGEPAYIEGNRDHPVNRGVICAKGAAGIMSVRSPARLRAPLRRTGPRGSGQFEEIGWDEAIETIVGWLRPVRERAPEKFAFFTGRDQSQSFTGWWAQAFGTPNWAAHGGFCSVNMAAAGIYTMGGSFWEFGQPDWERTRLLLLFGVAEDHDSNPIKIGLGQLKGRGGRVIAFNPVRTGYNAIADEWVPVRPGTDGLLILAIVHELIRAGRVDLEYLARFTNAPFLVDADPASDGHGLFLRGEDGEPLVIDRRTGAPAPWNAPGVEPHPMGQLERGDHTHPSVLRLIVERYASPDYAPEAVADRCGVSAARIRAIAAEIARTAFEEAIEIAQPWTDWRGVRHESMKGRPVSVHAMRGISAHSNGFQTCRALHLLQILIGSVEVPGGFRFKPPYPKPARLHPRPHAGARPGQPLDGPHLGYPQGPEDLLVDGEGRPLRIDGAYGWEAPLAAHGMMQMVIANAHAGRPYPIDTLMLFMANMAWNSAMDTTATIDMLTDRREDGSYVIPHLVVADAFASEITACADIVLPDTTYLERHDCISLLDRPICEADAAADAIRWPVIEPDRDVRPFQSVLLEIGARLGLPGMVGDDGAPRYRDYADYIVNHERRPGVGPLAGWRLDEEGREVHGRGRPNPRQLERYIANGGFWTAEVPEEARFFKPWNAAWWEWSVAMGLVDAPAPYVFDLYLEPLQKFRLAAEGRREPQPPAHLRARILEAFDPLPVWYEPYEHRLAREAGDLPDRAVTQRPMAMYHSWGSHNAWLRQIHGHNVLYVARDIWEREGFEPGDWAHVVSANGRIRVPVALMEALAPGTVWT